ncbi:MAG: hypothetical protein ACRDJC_16700, partial [Thermomicrobiales bacterium]
SHKNWDKRRRAASKRRAATSMRWTRQRWGEGCRFKQEVEEERRADGLRRRQWTVEGSIAARDNKAPVSRPLLQKMVEICNNGNASTCILH